MNAPRYAGLFALGAIAACGGGSAVESSGCQGTQTPTMATLSCPIASATQRPNVTLRPPATPVNGYYTVTLTGLAPTTVGSLSVAGDDNGEIAAATGSAAGATVLSFVSLWSSFYKVTPGEQVAAGPYPINAALRYTFTPINDSYEPNDTRERARDITTATPISAYMVAGYTRGRDIAIDSYDDWYRFQNPRAGMVTVQVSSVPASVQLVAEIIDANMTIVQASNSPAPGASFDVIQMDLPAGTFLVRIGAFMQPSAESAAGSAIPEHWRTPYTFRVITP